MGRGKGGRPTKLTPEVQERICDALRKGCTRRAAAAYAGISEDTLYNWIARGEGRAKSPPREEFTRFSEAVKRAESEAEKRYTEIIYRAADETWQAAAWWLERRYPKEWGRRERHEVQGSEDGPPIVIKHRGDFDFEKFIETLIEGKFGGTEGDPPKGDRTVEAGTDESVDTT